MIRNRMLASVTGAAVLAFASPAFGGVINELRPNPQWSQWSVRLDGPPTLTAKAAAQAPGGPGRSEGNDQQVQQLAAHEGSQSCYEYEMAQLQAGLITEEEMAAGCGGASAATGPVGLLPFLVAGLALVRRRR